MTKKEKSAALINCFVTGETEILKEILKEDYIQHNLNFPSGKQALIQAIEGMKKAPQKTTAQIVRTFEDGDYVFMHNLFNFAGQGQQVSFDIFRFENGLIAEHWDNIQNFASSNKSGHTQVDGPTQASQRDKTVANKQTVLHFLQDIVQGKNPGNFFNYFEGENYIQHNTQGADGVTAMQAMFAELAKSGMALVFDKIHMVLGEGNFVLAVSEGSFGSTPTSFYDLFRVENGKIAEHWDIIETILPKDKWQNSNGKF